MRRWRENPVAFVYDVFHVEPDAWQRKVLEAFPSQDFNKQRMSMQACVGPGKSALLAWVGWNFLLCYGSDGEHPKAAAVSITSDNLADNLWAEFSKWQSRSQLLLDTFQWTKTRIFAKNHPETWFISARSWPKTANPEEQGRVLSGLHSRFVLYLIDESGDIPPAVLRAAEQGLSNCEWGKIMQAGNPTSLEGMLYLASNLQREKWFIVRITSDPDDPMRTPRVDIEWAREQIKTYGRDNPWVMSSILGMFPPASINSLLGQEEVLAAMKRAPKFHDYESSQRRIGVDVARFGDDRTVLFPRQGLMAYKPSEMRNARSNDIAARLLKMKSDFGSEMEMIDDTGGYGAGVIDFYLQAGHAAIPVCYSGKAIDPRYYNKRSEIWFEMAKWVKRGGALPDVPELVKELSAPTYTFFGGKLRLEEKDQIKKRLGFSPDFGDALANTFALPEMPRAFVIPGLNDQPNKLKSEYDPFADVQSGQGHSQVGKVAYEYDPFA